MATDFKKVTTTQTAFESEDFIVVFTGALGGAFA